MTSESLETATSLENFSDSKLIETNEIKNVTLEGDEKGNILTNFGEAIINKNDNAQIIGDNNSNDDSVIIYKPLVVVGPSGVGKGTLLEYLPKRFENIFARAISHTTRDKRQHEIDGVHYHFVTKDDFEKKIKENSFLEYANIHGKMYGTSYQSITDVKNKKNICILEKDFQGALAIKNANIDAYFVFITCNGQIETLRQRLKGRQTENDDQINNRLKTAEIEFDFLNKNESFFDYILSNDDLDKTKMEFVTLLKKWYPGIEDSWYTPTVVVGPSGVGKGTLLQHIKRLFPNTFGVSVSHTTRPPRINIGEQNGIHYHFVSKEEFEKDIQNRLFIEYACVHGNYYGTSKKSIQDVINKQQICLLEIDYQGAILIKKSSIKARYIFISCSGGLQTLESRLLGRNTEDNEKIRKRLKTAETEFKFLENNKDFFDLILYNDDFSECLQQLTNQFKSWYPWIEPTKQ